VSATETITEAELAAALQRVLHGDASEPGAMTEAIPYNRPEDAARGIFANVLAHRGLPDPVITCAACHHTAPTMAEVAWQPDWKQWRCTDPAACHKRQQEAGIEGRHLA
jgi:hypothetical protein